MRSTRGVVAALLAGLVGVAGVSGLAGCGAASTAGDAGPAPVGPEASGTPSSVPHDPCADWPYLNPPKDKKPRWQRETLPAGFQPVLLITCADEERTTPNAGEWTYRIEKHATEGLSAVVAALRSTPPPPPSGPIACAASYVADPWFLLVDRDGRVVLPKVPHERACNTPIDVGLGRLHYTVVSAKRIMQQATPAELATECPGQWKNIPRMFAPQSKPAQSRQTVASRPLRICTYSTRSSKDPEVGNFTGGLRLSSEEQQRIGALLTGDAPRVGVGPCQSSDDYAVVFPARGSEVYVELSGCQRMFVDDTIWTAPVPRLVRAIKDLHLQR